MAQLKFHWSSFLLTVISAAMSARADLILPPVTASTQTPSIKLVFYNETSIGADLKINGHRVGGLSALTWTGDKLLLVSDDRGKYGPARIYEADFDVKKAPRVHLEVRREIELRGIPRTSDRPVSLDTEGLLRWDDGRIVVSSEGDTNRKPREPSRILLFKPDGQFESEIPVPEAYLAEKTGRQTKGTINNMSFEGLSRIPGTQSFWVATEKPLVQDTDPLEVRLLKYDADGKKWKAGEERRLKLNAPIEGSHEIFRGLSEILALSEDRLLVLERSLKVLEGAQAYNYGGALYHVVFEKGKMTKKELLIDFNKAIERRVAKSVRNFEGLTWGPLLPDGRRSLLVLSDNNFTGGEDTEILVFAVEGNL